jgi:(E)-4-hydroxy-3-methylbut-2-enyl-diphosphate synthase
MMEANLLLYNTMIAQGRVYPFHLGVTEAANEMEGRVKSAIGIGGLILFFTERIRKLGREIFYRMNK